MSLNSDLLKSFAALKQEEKEVKARVEEMKVRVLQELTAADLDEVAIPDVGMLVVVPKRTYTYPAVITKAEEDLKKAKKEAEAKGTATYTEAPFVRFDALKT